MEKMALGCYHDTCLKTDVLLLADVFETFENTCLKNYKLESAHFYTVPELGWEALLKTADEYCKLEKSVMNVNYALTSSGLSCLQI